MRIFMIGVALAALSTGAVARGGGHGGSHSSSRSSHSSRSTSYHSTSEHYVSGYVRSNGTHVQGHYQTNPNNTRNDNYSTRGNINPHTGQPGTKPGDEEAPH